MSMPIEKLLSRLNAKRSGEGYIANCPAHEDRKPSLSINEGRDGRVLLHCHAGCSTDDVLAAAGLTKRDLFPQSTHGSKPIGIYDYTNERGELRYQVLRFKPKRFSQHQPDGKGGWIYNTKNVRRVLYNLPAVIESQIVAVTEGEKDADSLIEIDIVATTNCGGAGKWRDDYSKVLRGKDVIVFGDDDEPGRNHVKQVVESLTGKARSVKIVTLRGFHDISDFIAARPAETAKQAVETLINEAPVLNSFLSFAHDAEVEPAELPLETTPYVPPPLALLPSQLQEHAIAAAESLNVDISFILLPQLSSLGAAIGNSRSIILKSGFVQPPNIWSAIIGRSGARKSPALDAGCFGVMNHERELMQQNKHAREQYESELEEWQSKKPKTRGLKPDSPAILTCVMDDLTIEALADVLIINPHGVLIRKDELAHLFGSFDQYKSHAKGSDVSRWLSLHTGVFLAVDRRTDNRHHRIWQPRVCITGAIQPKVLRRALTEDFFERGLPARFLVAHPPFRQDKWSDATVPGDIKTAALNLFEELWLLQPEKDDSDNPRPKLLHLDPDAKAEFVKFYDECGAAALEADEHGEAAYCKLTAYAARFALVGQLARDPTTEVVTGDVMQAAYELARWCGKEALRIYAELAETREQREQRELIEFIQHRGGAVYERELMQSYTRLKNDKSGTERELVALVKAGRGEWEPVEHGGGPGRPTRKFRLLRSSTSTQFGIPRGKTGISVDVDARGYQKITPSEQPVAVMRL
jgi:5S rRNA maturation endonuclease (ribonuclease M5)